MKTKKNKQDRARRQDFMKSGESNEENLKLAKKKENSKAKK